MRVLIDVAVLPKTQISVYAINIINFGLFATCSWFVFSYLELYQNAKGFSAAKTRALYAIPYLCNIAILLSSPWTHAYFGVDENAAVFSGSLWKLMVTINCSYPLAAILLSLFARFVRHENADSGDFKLSVVFPLFFAVFGPVSALQWRIPILPTGLMLADLFVYIHYTDILTRERNNALAKSLDEAKKANEAKSRFLSLMSHDIRTPMNAILGMNEMILREASDEGIREYAHNVQAAGKTLLSLINGILDFSKIEEGKMEIIPVRYDTAVLARNIINSISSQAEKKGLELSVSIDRELPARLLGDDVKIGQVIQNLLSNAVKYTHSGTVSFTMKALNVEDGFLDLFVEVKDTGIGIRKEDMERLFEPFERLDEKRNRAIQGTGLGISIVTRLLSMMGSRLEVQSVYGSGSAFSFTLRQKVEDPSPIGDYREQQKTKATEPPAGPKFYAPGAKVLVADDNEMNLRVAKNFLKLFGITPDLASSGYEVLDKMRQKEYHLVLLDHMMPEMDGTETLRKLREENITGDAAVIAFTANVVEGTREEYLTAGFDGMLSKPIEMEKLQEALRQFLPEELLCADSSS